MELERARTAMAVDEAASTAEGAEAWPEARQAAARMAVAKAAMAAAARSVVVKEVVAKVAMLEAFPGRAAAAAVALRAAVPVMVMWVVLADRRCAADRVRYRRPRAQSPPRSARGSSGFGVPRGPNGWRRSRPSG